MIKGIIFDFDGVILESVDIKTEAFKELFSDYPDKISEITRYHLLNGGISRFVKFRYIHEKILKKGLSGDREIELGRRFSEIVSHRMAEVPFVAGAKEFLEKNKQRYRLFLASGTPEEELNTIARLRGLGGYFYKIYGSPRQKIDIINDILRDYNFSKNEIVFVGDSASDYIAAAQAGIVFIARRLHLASDFTGHSWVIKDLRGLERVLEKIEGGLS